MSRSHLNGMLFQVLVAAHLKHAHSGNIYLTLSDTV